MTQIEAPTHNDIICSSLYSNGYVKGLYSDCLLRIVSSLPSIDGIVFKIHKLLAIKSPLLANYLNESDSSSIILNCNNPHLTPEGLWIAIGHLYASYSSSILKSSLSGSSPTQRAILLKSVLASATLLRLADLVHLCSGLIQRDICLENFSEYVDLAATDATLIELNNYLFEFLTNGIFQELSNPWQKGSSEYDQLVDIFAKVPFELLKKVIESKELKVSSDMER